MLKHYVCPSCGRLERFKDSQIDCHECGAELNELNSSQWLTELTVRMAARVMRPTDCEEQKISFIYGVTGTPKDEIRRILRERGE